MSSEDDDVITIMRKKPNQIEEGTVSRDGFVKTCASKQDDINSDPTQIQTLLADYEQILPNEYNKMENGTFIRYIKYDSKSKPQIRLGGFLIKNGAPDYWVLKAGSKGRRAITWSVPLTKTQGATQPNVYYRKKGVLHGKEDKIRYGADVYECLESGRYTLIQTDVLENIVGHTVPGKKPQQPKTSSIRSRKLKTELVDEDESDDDTPKIPHQKIKARFKE
jgi:hypothetical protein